MTLDGNFSEQLLVTLFKQCVCVCVCVCVWYVCVLSRVLLIATP